jgi:hypothetical protein
MDALIESAQGDLRIMLGQLQMHRLRSSSLSFENVKAAATKDMDRSPFDCARRLLSTESAHWTMMDKLNAVFQDMDLVPLLVQVRDANVMATNRERRQSLVCVDVIATPFRVRHMFASCCRLRALIGP